MSECKDGVRAFCWKLQRTDQKLAYHIPRTFLANLGNGPLCALVAYLFLSRRDHVSLLL